MTIYCDGRNMTTRTDLAMCFLPQCMQCYPATQRASGYVDDTARSTAAPHGLHQTEYFHGAGLTQTSVLYYVVEMMTLDNVWT